MKKVETPKINFDYLIQQIEEILSKGEEVKMKNKEIFRQTLKTTKTIITENKNLFNSYKNDSNMDKIFEELENRLQDVESKLNKLSLINFCRDKAEKYLSNVTQRLDQINMVLLSFVAGANMEKEEIVDNNQNYNDKILEQINEQNKKIELLEKMLKEKKEAKKEKIPLTNYNEQLFLGLKYLNGIDTRKNYKLAYECFDSVTTNDNNNSDAKVLLAKMYEKGYYVEKSYTKALELYQQACELDNPLAAFKIAYYAENKFFDINIKHLDKNYTNYKTVAMEYYQKAADKGYSDAVAYLGYIYENGLLDNEVNQNSAIDYYKKSIELDENPMGLNGMGNYYYRLYKEEKAKGSNEVNLITKYAKLVVENYSKAAKLGNIDAINNLGTCYEYGIGVQKNYTKALEYYKKAGDKHHSIALSNQAILLFKINLKENLDDYDECYKLLNLSIGLDKNNNEAYYYLGMLYEMGYDLFHDGNCSPNAVLAFFNYKRAAELGHINAKTKVGVAVFNGIENCFRSNEEQGIELLKEASNEGDKEASDYLDFLKSNGKLFY